MDDLERALNDGINTFKALTRDGRLLPGAGATEIELAKQLTSYGEVREKQEREGGKEGERVRPNSSGIRSHSARPVLALSSMPLSGLPRRWRWFHVPWQKILASR